MNIVEVGLFVAGALSLAIGASALTQRQRGAAALFFFLTTLGVSGWEFGIALFLYADQPEVLFIVAAAYYIAAALIALATLWIGYTLREKGHRHGFCLLRRAFRFAR